VLVARTNADVAALNRDAHRLLDDAGQLGGERVIAGGREFGVGDHVRALKNHRDLDVDNGDRGIVVAVDPDRRELTVHLRAGREVTLPAWYLEEGNVTYGYALTAHAVQGSTVDRSFALGAERMYA
jgi:ATP-dependent exoDNAse (exonuclease V) alpha subunit